MNTTPVASSSGSSDTGFLPGTKAMACIHCGLCLPSCPTYLETGNENDSPRGRIYLMRAIDEGRLEAHASAHSHIDLCLGCRACEAACPSGVEYGQLLEHARQHLEPRAPRSLWQRLLRRVLISRVFPNPALLRLALLPARLLQRADVAHLLPKPLAGLLALLPENPEASRLPTLTPARADQTRGRVALLPGCVMSELFGGTHRNTLRLLAQAGYEVHIPPLQGCCGALHAHGGDLAAARAAARVNIAAFEAAGCDAVLVNAAGCGSTLKEYSQLLSSDPVWAERARLFSSRVRDVVEWLVPDDLPIQPQFDGPTVTYHDACHLAHAQRCTQQPRALLRAAVGPRFVELPEADVCCGSAGSYNLTEPAMAARLGRRKIRHIRGTEASIVVTTNPGCLLQIQSGLRDNGPEGVRAVHLIDFLAEHLAPRPSGKSREVSQVH